MAFDAHPSHAQWRKYLSQLFPAGANGATETMYQAIKRAGPQLRKATALAISAMESAPAGKHGNCLNVLHVNLQHLLKEFNKRSKLLLTLSSEDAIKAWHHYIYTEIQNGRTSMPIAHCYATGMNQIVNHGSIMTMLQELNSKPEQKATVETQLQYALLSALSGSVIYDPKSPAYDSLREFYNKRMFTQKTYNFATWIGQMIREFSTLIIVVSLAVAAVSLSVGALGGVSSVTCYLSNTLTQGWKHMKAAIAKWRPKDSKQAPSETILLATADHVLQDAGSNMAVACPTLPKPNNNNAPKGCPFDRQRPCVVIPSKGGYSVVELRAMAPHCGIAPAAAKQLKKTELCAALLAAKGSLVGVAPVPLPKQRPNKKRASAGTVARRRRGARKTPTK